MKANELMIGDWLHHIQDSDKFQITEIIADGDRSFVGTDEWSTNIKYIEPIPLTEDILKANDFEKSGISYLHRYDDKPHHYDFKLQKGGAFVDIGFSIDCDIYILTINYVHELQHALRLCGLNELADNFKIE